MESINTYSALAVWAPKPCGPKRSTTAVLPDRPAKAASVPPPATLSSAPSVRPSSAYDRGQDYFEERYRQRVLHNLAQGAKAMGMQLVPSEVPPEYPMKINHLPGVS
jgi:hypothetical protein